MIENLSSKIDSLTDKTSCDLNQDLIGVNSENVILENRPIELNEFQQDASQHNNFLSYKICGTFSEWNSSFTHGMKEDHQLDFPWFKMILNSLQSFRNCGKLGDICNQRLHF